MTRKLTPPELPELPVVQESRVVASHRLRGEGRWPEATLWRDDRISELKRLGLTGPGEAKDRAWLEMIGRFPPLPKETTAPKAKPPALEDDAPTDLLDQLAAVPFDWARDVKYVYAHLKHPRAKIEDAPSLAAWGLLDFAREETTKFFAMVAQVAGGRASAVTDTTAEADTDPGLTDLDKMIG
jgi:hypothetical protein